MKKKLFLLLLFLICNRMFSQSGIIQGTILDAFKHIGINGSILQIDGGKFSEPQTIKTEKFGQFTISGLFPGSYCLTASANGYQDTWRIIELNNNVQQMDLYLNEFDLDPSVISTINIVKRIQTKDEEVRFQAIGNTGEIKIPPNTKCELIYWEWYDKFRIFAPDYKEDVTAFPGVCNEVSIYSPTKYFPFSRTNRLTGIIFKIKYQNLIGFIGLGDLNPMDRKYFESLHDDLPTAQVSISHPKLVSRNKDGEYKWVTYFKETSIKTGVKLTKVDCYVEGYNEKGEKGKWIGCDGGDVELSAGGEDSFDHIFSEPGIYHAIWSGRDGYGHTIKVEEIVSLK